MKGSELLFLLFKSFVIMISYLFALIVLLSHLDEDSAEEY